MERKWVFNWENGDSRWSQSVYKENKKRNVVFEKTSLFLDCLILLLYRLFLTIDPEEEIFTQCP